MANPSTAAADLTGGRHRLTNGQVLLITASLALLSLGVPVRLGTEFYVIGYPLLALLAGLAGARWVLEGWVRPGKRAK